MAKTILTFGASNSKNSINKQLAYWAAGEVEGAEVNRLDLNDFEMPIYSIDREKDSGIPQLAQDFKAHILAADGIIISFAEHNGAYTVAFKNIFDWVSRMDKDVWSSKPLFLLSTSPGGRGAATVMEIALNKFKRMNNNVVLDFSLPSFFENFSPDKGIIPEEQCDRFKQKLDAFVAAL